MGLSVCGFNHKTANLEEREPFQIIRSETGEATQRYKEISGCEEAVVISTCNRVEFYQYTPEKSEHLPDIIRFYQERGVSDTDKLRDICYCRQKTTVARHVFRVAAGLDSMVLGEDQVFHQLKDAYSAACAVGGPEKILHKVFHMAFQAGKRVRSETNIGAGPRSVSGAALEMLKSRLEGHVPSSVLVCGVNEMTEIILNGLTRWETPVYLANRTPDKAEKLAASFKAKPLPLDNIGDVLPEVEVVFSAISSPDPILLPEHFKDRTAKSHPLFLVDLGIPRNISPELGEAPGTVLLDLEDIKRYLEHSESVRAADIPLAEEIIEEQVSEYSTWRAKLRQQDKMLSVHRDLNKLRKAELDRFKEGFHLSEYRALDAFSQALVKNFMRLLPDVLESDEGRKGIKDEG